MFLSACMRSAILRTSFFSPPMVTGWRLVQQAVQCGDNAAAICQVGGSPFWMCVSSRLADVLGDGGD